MGAHTSPQAASALGFWHVPRAGRRQHDRLRRLPAAGEPGAARLECGLSAGCRPSPARLCLAVVFVTAGARPCRRQRALTLFRRGVRAGAGFVVAWSYWISTWVDQRGARARGRRATCPSSGPGSPVPRSPRPSPSPSIWLLVLVNCLGVRVAGDDPAGHDHCSSSCPLFAAIVVAVWAISSGASERCRPHNAGADRLGAISAAATITLFPMLGFEIGDGRPAERVEDPEAHHPARHPDRHRDHRHHLSSRLLGGDAAAAGRRASPGSNAPFAYFFGTLIRPRIGAPGRPVRRDRRPGRAQRLHPAPGRAAARRWRGTACSPPGSRPRIASNRPIACTCSRAGSPRCWCWSIIRAGLADLFQFMVLLATSTTIIFYIAGILAGLQLAGAGTNWNVARLHGDCHRRPVLFAVDVLRRRERGEACGAWPARDRHSRSISSMRSASRSSPAPADGPAAPRE